MGRDKSGNIMKKISPKLVLCVIVGTSAYFFLLFSGILGKTTGGLFHVAGALVELLTIPVLIVHLLFTAIAIMHLFSKWKQSKFDMISACAIVISAITIAGMFWVD